MERHYLAVDVGASSGRSIVGTLKNGWLTLREINRFWNGPTEIRGTLYWDFAHLFRNIREGMASAKKECGGLVSMGIDTWGVDFGLLDEEGKLLGNPMHYRDRHTAGMIEKIVERVPRKEVFAQTGIQFMELNTLCQLMSLSLENSFQYRNAKTLLFSPDLFGYWLTGNRVAERTIASTSQFYNPVKKDWAYDLLARLGLRSDFLADLVNPGTVIGDSDGLPVVAVGGHDTASAFAAVPTGSGERSGVLSSGTWSLLGTELPEPIIDDKVLSADFTNETGVCGMIRFLKSLSGLWILQELRRDWNEQGYGYSWQAMERMASEAEPFRFFINPNDEIFFTPGNMSDRVRDYFKHTGQGQPETNAQILRAAYEGLALLYTDACDMLEQLSGRKLDTLRIVGGGCRDALLIQFFANAAARRVFAGPAEAAAVGNLIVQMLAMGDIHTLQEGREIIHRSFAKEIRTFEPCHSEAWKKALEKWREIFRADNFNYYLK